jgi:hypothetical protein
MKGQPGGERVLEKDHHLSFHPRQQVPIVICTSCVHFIQVDLALSH